MPGSPGLARADYHISPLSSANIFAALAISAVARCGDVVRSSLLINHQLWRAQVLEVALHCCLAAAAAAAMFLIFCVLSAGTDCVCGSCSRSQHFARDGAAKQDLARDPEEFGEEMFGEVLQKLRARG